MVMDKVFEEEIVFPAKLDELDLVHDWCRRHLAALGVSQIEEHNILLALSEAVTNAIRHGCKEDWNKMVRVVFSSDRNGITIVVRDQGKGFKPESLPDPTVGDNLLSAGGRGVFLLKALASQVQFHCTDHGTTVTFSFQRNY